MTTPYGRPVLAVPSSLVSGLQHNQRAQDYCALFTIVGLGGSSDLASGTVFPNVRERPEGTLTCGLPCASGLSVDGKLVSRA